MKTYLLLALVLLVACKKDNIDPDGLVRATQQGKNTGDFLLNGTPFNPKPRVTAPANKPVGAYWYHRRKGDSSVNISLFREENDGTDRIVDILISNLFAAGSYPITDAVNPNVVPGAQSYIQYTAPGTYPAAYTYFLTGPDAPGQVIITRFDTVARVVSGTFEAQLQKYKGPESLSITKGRFDCSF